MLLKGLHQLLQAGKAGPVRHARCVRIFELDFDPAHNLLPANTPNQTGSSAGFVQNNRLKVFEDKRYEHDVHGRVSKKRIGGHTEIELIWDAEHQLTKAVTTRNGVKQTTEYAYDPFGRRLYKRGKFAATWFLWDGNSIGQGPKPVQLLRQRLRLVPEKELTPKANSFFAALFYLFIIKPNTHRCVVARQNGRSLPGDQWPASSSVASPKN